jgi:hypothetical protein
VNNNITIVNNDGIESNVELVAFLKVTFNGADKDYLIYSTPEAATGDKATIQISQAKDSPGIIDSIPQDDWENLKNILVHIIRKEQVENVEMISTTNKTLYVSDPKKLSLTFDKKQSILDAQAQATINNQLEGNNSNVQGLYNQELINGGDDMNNTVTQAVDNTNIAFGGAAPTGIPGSDTINPVIQPITTTEVPAVTSAPVAPAMPEVPTTPQIPAVEPAMPVQPVTPVAPVAAPVTPEVPMVGVESQVVATVMPEAPVAPMATPVTPKVPMVGMEPQVVAPVMPEIPMVGVEQTIPTVTPVTSDITVDDFNKLLNYNNTGITDNIEEIKGIVNKTKDLITNVENKINSIGTEPTVQPVATPVVPEVPMVGMETPMITQVIPEAPVAPVATPVTPEVPMVGMEPQMVAPVMPEAPVAPVATPVTPEVPMVGVEPQMVAPVMPEAPVAPMATPVVPEVPMVGMEPQMVAPVMPEAPVAPVAAPVTPEVPMVGMEPQVVAPMMPTAPVAPMATPVTPEVPMVGMEPQVVAPVMPTAPVAPVATPVTPEVPMAGMEPQVVSTVPEIPMMPSLDANPVVSQPMPTQMTVEPKVIPPLNQGQEQIASVELPPVIMPDGMTNANMNSGFPNANLGNPTDSQ